MKIIINKYIPFKGFGAINLFGFLFVRKGVYKNNTISKRTLNHEKIHTAQMKEMGYIFFYIWYFIEWFIRLFINGKQAYDCLVFEKEAYDNDDNFSYLDARKNYSWLKYYGKK